MTTPRQDGDVLDDVPELLLRLLARRPMHGYELVRDIRLLSDEVPTFGEGCIYPILHRLEADGCIRGERKAVGGRMRVVYRLQRPGRKRLSAAKYRWKQAAAAVAAVLKGDGDAAPNLG